MSIEYITIRNSDGMIMQRGFRPDDTADAIPADGYSFETVTPDDPRRPDVPTPAAVFSVPGGGLFDALFEAMETGEIPKATRFYEAMLALRNRIPP